MTRTTSFQLVGHINPIGEYPAPVIPVGLVDGSLSVAFANEGSVDLQALAADASFVLHAHHTVVGVAPQTFRPEVHRLMGLRSDLVRAYECSDRSALQQLLIGDNLIHSAPFLAISVAIDARNPQAFQASAIECVSRLVDKPEFLDRWYPEMVAKLPASVRRTVSQEWRQLLQLPRNLPSMESDPEELLGSAAGPAQPEPKEEVKLPSIISVVADAKPDVRGPDTEARASRESQLSAQIKSFTQRVMLDPIEDLPRVLGNYELRRVIGMGGCSVVYAAWDRRLGRQVALKVPRHQYLQTSQFAGRFVREAKIMATVGHVTNNPILDCGFDGVPFIAMPLHDGDTLASTLRHDASVSETTDLSIVEDKRPSSSRVGHKVDRREWPMPSSKRDVRAILGIMRRLADMLSKVHDANVVHRDIKPGN